MTNDKKEQERSALHATIWRIANDLRGSVDGWDFKQYVLGMLFCRSICESLASYINEKRREVFKKNELVSSCRVRRPAPQRIWQA
jgi:type I restriction enzyme M protein